MIRWGILGLAKIANKFAEAIQEVDNANLVAISQAVLLSLGVSP